MARENTKMKIAMTALELFSEKGYDGVGIELLAKTVGIKGASIYAHYKGKEEILDTIVAMMDKRYEEQFGSLNHIGDMPKTPEAFVEDAMRRIRFSMTDPQIKRARRLCTMEQFRNQKLAALTTLHTVTGNVRMYEVILGDMMERGLLKKDDAYLLAVELVTPVSCFIGVADREPERVEEMLSMTRRFLDHFVLTHR